jgi:DNA/RNA endonuclease YhcR with UshA esterase domain
LEKLMRNLLAVAIVLGSFASFAPAQDAPAPAPAEPTPAPSTKPADAVGEVIDAKDAAEKLKDKEGVTVSVRGVVSEVFTGKSGIAILNFKGIPRRSFNAVIQKEDVDTVKAGSKGELAGELTDKTIVVTGPVALYRGNPQIAVKTPDQIKVEKASEEKPAEAKPDEKKE